MKTTEATLAKMTATFLGGRDVEPINISMNAGVKITIWVTTEGQPVVISTSKNDVINHVNAEGAFGSNHSTGKIAGAMNLLASRINEVGLVEAIRQVGNGVFCACCGCPLTDDLSVMRGLGPVCWNKLRITSSIWKEIINNIATRHQQVEVR